VLAKKRIKKFSTIAFLRQKNLQEEKNLITFAPAFNGMPVLKSMVSDNSSQYLLNQKCGNSSVGRAQPCQG
jgi:hypothetical protein